MDNNFKPYIPADKVTTEMTPASVILGIVLADVIGFTQSIEPMLDKKCCRYFDDCNKDHHAQGFDP